MPIANTRIAAAAVNTRLNAALSSSSTAARQYPENTALSKPATAATSSSAMNAILSRPVAVAIIFSSAMNVALRYHTAGSLTMTASLTSP